MLLAASQPGMPQRAWHAIAGGHAENMGQVPPTHHLLYHTYPTPPHHLPTMNNIIDGKQ
jgi:hypothetical protein